MSFEDHDVCRITNKGETPVEFKFNSRKVTVQPGKSGTVPVQAAIIALGDPRSSANIKSWKSPYNNETGWIPDRATEVRRLRCKYGLLDGNDHTFQDKTGEIGPSIPNVEMEILQDGEYVKVKTVLQDPKGIEFVDESKQAYDVDSLREALAKNQRIISQLLAAQGEPDDFGSEEDIPVDDPSKAMAIQAETKQSQSRKVSA